MLRLIKSDLASTWKSHLRNGTPSRFLNLSAHNVVLCEISYFGFKIVAHEIDLLGAALIGGVDRGFCWRQGEDQPAVTRIHRLDSQNVAKKCSIRIGVFTVDNYVSASKSFARSSKMPDWRW